MTKQTMGEFLGVLRKSHGYTQQEVAEKLNVSNRTLSSWETDRTTPDILLLPAIADLYGVTVDELIRGVRGENAESENKVEFSENALHASRKHRYGKFSTNSIILTGVGCFCSALFAVAFILNLYLATPLWLDLLLWILSACGVIACGIILLTFKHNLMVTEGIVLNEDYAEENKAFAFTVNRKTVNYLLICALPLLVVALVLLCVFIPEIYHLDNYVFTHYNLSYAEYAYYETLRSLEIKAYLIAILPTAIIGLCLLSAYGIINKIIFNKFADDEQEIIFKRNSKFLLIISFIEGAVLVISTISLFTTYIYEDSFWMEGVPPVCMILIALTFLICSIIYVVKRKKLKYDFR